MNPFKGKAFQGRRFARVRSQRDKLAASIAARMANVPKVVARSQGNAAHGRTISPDTTAFYISAEARNAFHERKPMVALESTIYTHGWPYPENNNLAQTLEKLVRAHGAVPVTIGVLKGRAIVGLSPLEMEELLEERTKLLKISRRDLAFATTFKASGGTTIASTLHLARMAGISVFATGGLGGVHRGGEISLDISADLTEFAHSSVALIASGCKGFLDIPRTLEFLETQGVPVATFADHRTGDVDFPAFWSRDSGVPSPQKVANEELAAKALINQQMLMPNGHGMLFANPVPESASIPRHEMETMIAEALKAADAAGATGSSNTPFVLRKLQELSKGRTNKANQALIESNVVRGATLAKHYEKLLETGYGTPMPTSTVHQPAQNRQKLNSEWRDLQNHFLEAGLVPPPETTSPEQAKSKVPRVTRAGGTWRFQKEPETTEAEQAEATRQWKRWKKGQDSETPLEGGGRIIYEPRYWKGRHTPGSSS